MIRLIVCVHYCTECVKKVNAEVGLPNEYWLDPSERNDSLLGKLDAICDVENCTNDAAYRDMKHLEYCGERVYAPRYQW